MNRISRDKMFMEVAKVVAQRGTCDRARVGAVLVDRNNNIVSIGYNGSPTGTPHCDEAGHIMSGTHCIRTIHAEENCLNRLMLGSPTLHDIKYTMYVTHYPCVKCQATMLEWCYTRKIKLDIVFDKMYGNYTCLSTMDETYNYLRFSRLKEDKE